MRCTLFSPVVDRRAIESVCHALPDWTLSIEGDPESWGAVRLTSARGLLLLHSQEFTAPQDAFSKLLLGTSGYFWLRDDLSEATKKDILRFVGSTRWLIGIVGTSEDAAPQEAEFLDAALALARRLGGRIFTGTELLVPARE